LPAPLCWRLWDTLIAESASRTSGGGGFADFIVFFCVSFLLSKASELCSAPFDELMAFLQTPPTDHLRVCDIEGLISEAYVLRAGFLASREHDNVMLRNDERGGIGIPIPVGVSDEECSQYPVEALESWIMAAEPDTCGTTYSEQDFPAEGVAISAVRSAEELDVQSSGHASSCGTFLCTDVDSGMLLAMLPEKRVEVDSKPEGFEILSAQQLYVDASLGPLAQDSFINEVDVQTAPSVAAPATVLSRATVSREEGEWLVVGETTQAASAAGGSGKKKELRLPSPYSGALLADLAPSMSPPTCARSSEQNSNQMPESICAATISEISTAGALTMWAQASPKHAVPPLISLHSSLPPPWTLKRPDGVVACPLGHALRPPSSWRSFLALTRWSCAGSREPGGCKSSGRGPGHWLRCETCDYDLCERCCATPRATTRVACCPAGHALVGVIADDGWACDGRTTVPDGCRSGVRGFHETYGMRRFRCEACDFDLCEKCCSQRAEMATKKAPGFPS